MPAPLVLGIETSTPWGGVALAESTGRLRGNLWAHSRTGYSRRLMPTLDALLSDAGIEPSHLAAIAVTHGPGSFTGVRIGLVTAKTLARSLKLPLFTFSTLEAVAWRWPLRDRPVAVLLDARRHEIYGALFRRTPAGAMETLIDESAQPPAQFFESLRTGGFDSVWLAGDAVGMTRPIWETALNGRARAVDMPWGLPSADSVARMGAQALMLGRAPTDPVAAAPHYLRASDAHRVAI